MSPFSDISQLSRGDVILVTFPFTNLQSAKRRPAILLTDTSAASGPDGHFIFTSSRVPPPHVLSIDVVDGSAEARQMGLRFENPGDTCHIHPLKVATLEVSLITKKIGTTPSSVLDEITARIAAALGLLKR